MWDAGKRMVEQWVGGPFLVRRRVTVARRPRHCYATATGHLASGAGWEMDKGVANCSRCVTTVTPGCAGLATPLATLPHWQSRLYSIPNLRSGVTDNRRRSVTGNNAFDTQAGEFPAPAATRPSSSGFFLGRRSNHRASLTACSEIPFDLLAIYALYQMVD